MRYARHLFLASLLAMLAVGTCAAQAEPPHNDANDHAKAVEDRLAAIEKRLENFEKQLFAPTDRYYAIPRESMDNMFNRMRRDIMGKGDAFSWDEFFGHGKDATNAKPRLGVELAKISDDLKTRYKNDVKQGAFVVVVEPKTPAEKAGLAEGDVITSFNGKAIASPRELSDAVKAASAGAHDLVYARHGESKTVKVEFTAEKPVAATDSAKKVEEISGWLWNGANGDQHLKSQTEIHVSALEMSDSLAKDLKLNDAQKKKMGDILAAQSKALTDDFIQQSKSAKSEEASFSHFSELVQKYMDMAAKELVGVLDAGQMKLWNEYREAHSSASFAQMITLDNTPSAGGKKFSAK